MTRIIPVVAMASLLIGCGPAWHRDSTVRLTHSIPRAVVYGDSLSLQGVIWPVVSVTDYGVRINEVRDDTGKQLALRSYQLFWMKELRFEAEFDAPTAAATSVNVDMEFLSRSGRQRVKAVLPLSRDTERDYRSQRNRWRGAW